MGSHDELHYVVGIQEGPGSLLLAANIQPHARPGETITMPTIEDAFSFEPKPY